MHTRRTRRLCLLLMLLTASEFDGVYGMLAAAGGIFSLRAENLAGRMHLFVWRRRRLFVFLQVPECSAEIDLCSTVYAAQCLEKAFSARRRCMTQTISISALMAQPAFVTRYSNICNLNIKVQEKIFCD